MLREFIISLLVMTLALAGMTAFSDPIYDQHDVTIDPQVVTLYNTFNQSLEVIERNVSATEQKFTEEGDYTDVVSGGFKIGKTTYNILKLPFTFLFQVDNMVGASVALFIGDSYGNLAQVIMQVIMSLLIVFLIFAFLRAILGRTP